MIVHEGPGNVLNSHRQTLVCTTNVVGAMGKGVALAFAQRYPDLLAFYQSKFPRRPERFVNPKLGRQLFVFPLNQEQQCLLFPTKLHWRDPSPVALIWDNLNLLVHDYEALGITSLAFPPLGCGNGGLDYRQTVRPMMQRCLAGLPIEADVLFAS